VVGIIASELHSAADKDTAPRTHELELRHAVMAQSLEANKDIPSLKSRPPPPD